MSDIPNGSEIVVSTEKPVFDFSNLSWKDARELDSIQRRINAVQTDDEEEAATHEMFVWLAKCVISIPRNWLIRSAPDAIDFTKPESFDFVRFDRVKTFSASIAEAMKPDNASKN